MNYEIGKYYVLNPDKYYWSVDLQRKVKFMGRVIVRLKQLINGKPAFGTLIDSLPRGIDIDTNNTIEYAEEDIIEGYIPSSEDNVPLFYVDF